VPRPGPFRAVAIVLMVALASGCFYIPRPLEEMNSAPILIHPDDDAPIFPMISSSNSVMVVVRDPDGDRLTAFWQVPGYPGPLETRQVDTGALTQFQLTLPRIEELHGQVVSVTIVDDHPDDPKSIGVDFTVEVL